jgi:hypothetical protein
MLSHAAVGEASAVRRCPHVLTFSDAALMLNPVLPRRLSILLVLWFAALGTGGLEYLHDLDHAREDARVAQASKAEGRPTPPAPVHDDSNCVVHAQLHAPLLGGHCVPTLLLFTHFVPLDPPVNVLPLCRGAPQRIDCRGPPLCSSSHSSVA